LAEILQPVLSSFVPFDLFLGDENDRIVEPITSLRRRGTPVSRELFPSPQGFYFKGRITLQHHLVAALLNDAAGGFRKKDRSGLRLCPTSSAQVVAA
jgi:hypothetical protein